MVTGRDPREDGMLPVKRLCDKLSVPAREGRLERVTGR